jgi:transposase InsO family protein
MRSKLVAQLLADLGVTKTHSRPHVPDDNPFSESQFKTMKYRPDFPPRFGCIEDARLFCREFFRWYNTEHYHSGLGLLTPEMVHYRRADEVVERRKSILLRAYQAHPERFVRKSPEPPTRPEAVWINPPGNRERKSELDTKFEKNCLKLVDTFRRPEHRNHVWTYDFVYERTHDGRQLRLLTIVDEYTRECLAIKTARRMSSRDVITTLAKLFVRKGVPEHIRSDNGPEFTAKAVRAWLERLGVKTLFIEPGSPWENGYIESFNGKLRDELLNGEIFYTVKEAQVLVEMWRKEYNQVRPHSSLGYRPPAPEAATPPPIREAI